MIGVKKMINLANDDYHNHPAMSQTKMKVLLECPRQFYIEYILGRKVDDKTPSKNLGNCLDLALTEPEKYNQLLVKHTKTTSVDGYITANWKMLIDEWITNLYQYKFNDDYFDDITFKEIINSCTMQDIIFYKYNDIDWRMKCDFLHIDKEFFIDLKSTRATTYDAYIKDFFNYGYHLQAASYVTGIKAAYSLDYLPQAYYIAISTTTGEIFAVKPSDRLITIGQYQIDKGCEIYKDNLITNAWAKDAPLQILDMPIWQENKIFNRLEK
jgi:hypothetical protein